MSLNFLFCFQDMGFGHGQSERAIRLYGTVHAALDALLSGKGSEFFFLLNPKVCLLF